MKLLCMSGQGQAGNQGYGLCARVGLVGLRCKLVDDARSSSKLRLISNQARLPCLGLFKRVSGKTTLFSVCLLHNTSHESVYGFPCFGGGSCV